MSIMSCKAGLGWQSRAQRPLQSIFRDIFFSVSPQDADHREVCKAYILLNQCGRCLESLQMGAYTSISVYIRAVIIFPKVSLKGLLPLTTPFFSFSAELKASLFHTAGLSDGTRVCHSVRASCLQTGSTSFKTNAGEMDSTQVSEKLAGYQHVPLLYCGGHCLDLDRARGAPRPAQRHPAPPLCHARAAPVPSAPPELCHLHLP